MNQAKMHHQVQRRIFEKSPALKRQAPDFRCVGSDWVEVTGFADWQRRFFNMVTSQAGHLEMRNGRRGPEWAIVPS